MTELVANDREPESAGYRCPACETPYVAGDRYCAECGAALPTTPHPAADDPWPRPLAPASAAPGEPAALIAPAPAGTGAASARESSLWLLGASPATVVGGGILLLLLAAALLFAGQREATGTIVMLSICLTPLALITLAIGIARAIGAQVRR